MGLLTPIKANKAYRLQQKGQREEARKLYEEAYAEGLNDPRYNQAYALLMTRMGEYQKAKEFLVKHQKTPGMSQDQRVTMLVNYAACCFRLGNIDKGIDTLEQQFRKTETGLLYQTLGYLYIEKYDAANKPAFEEEPVTEEETEETPEETAAESEENEAAGKAASDSNLRAIIPVSARTGMGTEDVLRSLFELLPEGEPFYDEDQVTTETEREIAGEIVREKALRLLQEEVPHGIAVTIDSMKYRTRKDGTQICDIDASIICERESHKLIVIGKQGSMLKKIGTAARTDIENMLQCKVNLKLWVKVRKDWKDNEQQMKSFGYDVRKYK